MPLITAACKRTSVPDAHPTGSLISIQQVCLYMNAPCEPHLALVKHILRYIKGTMDFGLHIGISDPTTLTAYSDADCVPDTQCSTSSFCIFLGDNLISWSVKRQTIVSRSSVKVEYRVVAHGVAKCC
jgi:hypothetical protein